MRFKVFSGNTFANALRKHRYEFQEDVESDFKMYGVQDHNTKYARPQVDYEDVKVI